LVSCIEGEYRVRVFQNRVLRRRFGAKREEGIGKMEKMA
jgi:hypothetical protein